MNPITHKRPCRLGPVTPRRRNGTAATNGQPGLRTTCALSAVSDLRVESARLWLLDTDGKPVSKQQFISLAVDELTRQLLAEHPDFKLPPSCSFPVTP